MFKISCPSQLLNPSVSSPVLPSPATLDGLAASPGAGPDAANTAVRRRWVVGPPASSGDETMCGSAADEMLDALVPFGWSSKRKRLPCPRPPTWL